MQQKKVDATKKGCNTLNPGFHCIIMASTIRHTFLYMICLNYRIIGSKSYVHTKLYRHTKNPFKRGIKLQLDYRKSMEK